MKKAILSIILLILTVNSYSEDISSENKSNENINKYDMTGLVFSLSGFNYFSCGIGINSGTYSTAMGHYGAITYGALLEYKTEKEIHIRSYIRLYGGSAGFLLGMSGIYANNFLNYSFGIGPEIGIGFNKINILYRYNLYLNNKFNCHEIALILYKF
jgi:hypothetical protein